MKHKPDYLNIRLSVTDKKTIRKAAKKHRRNISNYVITTVLDHIEYEQKLETEEKTL